MPTRFAAVLAIMLVAGCSARLDSMSYEQQRDIMPAFQQGRTVLGCRLACTWPWISRRQSLSRLAFYGQWNELARQVSEIGYQEDLGYYWLGRAAEAQGYYPAALRYYTVANAMTRAPDPAVHCINVGRERCFGINIAADTARRLGAIRRLAEQAVPPEPPTAGGYAPFLSHTLPDTLPDAPSDEPPAVRVFSPPAAPSAPPVPAGPDAQPARPPDDELELPPLRR